MRSVWAWCAVVLCVASVVDASVRTLVVVDDFSVKSTHSSFFRQLTGRGHALTFAKADSSDLALDKFGEWQYENLVLFSPAVEEFGGSVDVNKVLAFIDAGRNVLVAASSELSEPVREIASENGVDLDEEKSFVMDHFNVHSDSDDGSHTSVVADDFVDSPLMLGRQKMAPVVFRGIGLALADENLLVSPVLTGSSTSYSYLLDEMIKSDPLAVGKQTVLVAALQARNNARVLISGSLDLFSDKFFSLTVRGQQAGNQRFANEVSAWVFQERGLLRSSQVKHTKKGEKETPSVYRIKDEVSYSVKIEEWTGSAWVPFSANDVQLEFVMLDPYVRVNLKDNGKGYFSTTFQVPDVYGVFQFKLLHRRLGYSVLEENTKAVVRPYRHNEYERFIEAAYPYYLATFSSMGGFFLFSAVFLFGRYKK